MAKVVSESAVDTVATNSPMVTDGDEARHLGATPPLPQQISGSQVTARHGCGTIHLPSAKMAVCVAAGVSGRVELAQAVRDRNARSTMRRRPGSTHQAARLFVEGSLVPRS